jgi:uncharacterized protein DUF3991/Toprim domain-containing protein
MSNDPELEQFKHLDLREYAAAQGYSLDRRESWRGNAVMRNTAGDKIVIKLGPDGHYVYFSVRDDRDNGSIIDFIKNRSQTNLGYIRKELRTWSGTPRSPALPALPKMEVTAKDREKVERDYHRMQPAGRHPYLEEIRMIPASLLSSPRFDGRVRIDSHGNAVFPHFDAGGLAGYELKNSGFTGYATGGEKGLWTSRSRDRDRRLVFAESAIDALSYAAVNPDDTARYASIGGKTNPQQPGLIRSEIAKLPAGGEVVSAMDNDEDGMKLAQLIEAAVAESGREDLVYRSHSPALPAKDWNDVLRKSKPPSFPAARL